MKKSVRITAVLLSAAIAASFTGVTTFGESEITENAGSSLISEADASVYNITKGKSKTFSLKMSDVQQIAAKSSNKIVAKVTSISRKDGTVKVTVKGISTGTATIKVYDKKNPKNYKTIKVRVKLGSSSDDDQSSSSEKNPKYTIVVFYNGEYYVIETDEDPNALNEPEPTEEEKEQTTAEYVQGVFELVNKERSSRGIKELTLNESLCEAAAKRAKEVGSYFSHTRPDGTSCFTVLKDYNISYYTVGENIAQGQGSPEFVMECWMNSSGHKANILNTSFTQIGIGYDPDTNSWVQLFIG